MVLSLVAAPLSVPVLRAHLEGPLRFPDLCERIDDASQAALRRQLDKLRDLGAIERQVRGGMPYTVENELTDTGHGVLAVADAVEVWLSRAPHGPIALGSKRAKAVIGALIGGWDSTMLHSLAARPLSLTELDSVIAELNYPALERRLSAMRAARQVEPRASGGRGAKPFGVTDWTRQAIGPLAAAGRCECVHLADMTEPVVRVDTEAALLLAVPLVNLQTSRSGCCLLAVGTGIAKGGEPGSRIAGVRVEVREGAIASCVSRLGQDPRTWALGSIESWIEALLEGNVDRLRIEGESPALAKAVIANLHTTLSVA